MTTLWRLKQEYSNNEYKASHNKTLFQETPQLNTQPQLKKNSKD